MAGLELVHPKMYPSQKSLLKKSPFQRKATGHNNQRVVAAKLQAKNTCRTLGHRRLQLCTSMLRNKERGGSNPVSEGNCVKQKQREMEIPYTSDTLPVNMRKRKKRGSLRIYGKGKNGSEEEKKIQKIKRGITKGTKFTPEWPHQRAPKLSFERRGMERFGQRTSSYPSQGRPH